MYVYHFTFVYLAVVGYHPSLIQYWHCMPRDDDAIIIIIMSNALTTELWDRAESRRR